MWKNPREAVRSSRALPFGTRSTWTFKHKIVSTHLSEFPKISHNHTGLAYKHSMCCPNGITSPSLHVLQSPPNIHNRPRPTNMQESKRQSDILQSVVRRLTSQMQSKVPKFSQMVNWYYHHLMKHSMCNLRPLSKETFKVTTSWPTTDHVMDIWHNCDLLFYQVVENIPPRRGSNPTKQSRNLYSTCYSKKPAMSWFLAEDNLIY